MSKFEYESFCGGYGEFAVNSEKYTKEEAIKIFEIEMEPYKVGDSRENYTVGQAFTRHRAGVNEDSEPVVGWWLEYEEHKRACPVWEFHRNIYDKKWREDNSNG